jgi:hypothetical protein
VKAHTRQSAQTEEILQDVSLTERKSCATANEAQAMRGESVPERGRESGTNRPVNQHALRDAP